MLAERREDEEFDQGADQQWLWANALCNDGTGNLVALFFSEQLDDIARAKAFCGGCPVQEACFEAALVRREPYGVWGGMTEDEREAAYTRGRRLAAVG